MITASPIWAGSFARFPKNTWPKAAGSFPGKKLSAKSLNAAEPRKTRKVSVRTFLDSGVLITAHRGEPIGMKKALSILQDPDRVFLTSPFLYLETVPKAVYFRRESELAFYRIYFNDPSVEWCRDIEGNHEMALREANESGLGAIDALHVAAAHLLRADELITVEGAEKAIYRTSSVKIIQL